MALEILSETFFGYTLQNILIALGIIIAAIVIGKIVYYLFKTVGRSLTSKTKTDLDDVLIDIIEEPIVAMIFLAGVYTAFNFLGSPNGIINAMLKVATIAVLAWAAFRFVNSFVQKILVPLTSKTKSAFDDQMVPLVSKGSKGIIVVVALIMILDAIGFDVTALLAGLGIGGLALAFAAQETVSNLFGGVSLILDKSVKIGDKIRLDSGEVGIVDEVGLRSTRIRTYSNEVIIVPNSKMANSKLINYAQPNSLGRGEVKFGVTYGSDPDKVIKTITELIKKHPKVSKQKDPVVEFLSMGDFSLNFSAKFWCDDYGEVWGTERELTKEIYNGLVKNKINIPFPTQTIYLQKQK
ncbi:mechanosensitive ion channel [Candidatus Micrarchaeota archaeon]|nr:mechanosensitive ion channel [Candidatus Micrarchaeota archaeon]